MKTAHVKTVDGTTTMIQFKDKEEQSDFCSFIIITSSCDEGIWSWIENGEACFLFKRHIISVRFREVE